MSGKLMREAQALVQRRQNTRCCLFAPVASLALCVTLHARGSAHAHAPRRSPAMKGSIST